MSTKFQISVFGVCFLTLLATNAVSASSQKVIFYDQPNCAGRGDTMITGTSTNIRNNPRMAYANSTRVVGVWKIEIENLASFGSPKFHLGPNYAYPPEGRCINKGEWPVSNAQNFTIYSAIRIGPLDMTTPQLILYTETDFNGQAYTVNTELDMRQGPIQIKSYAHFSNETWTVYSDSRYNGTTQVLRSTTGNGPDSFEYDKNANMRIGSARKGDHDRKGGGGSGGDRIMVASLILVFASALISLV